VNNTHPVEFEFVDDNVMATVNNADNSEGRVAGVLFNLFDGGDRAGGYDRVGDWSSLNIFQTIRSMTTFTKQNFETFCGTYIYLYLQNRPCDVWDICQHWVFSTIILGVPHPFIKT